MNINEKAYPNKLSIYDLLVAKTKQNEKLIKDQLKKKLFINLSDLDSPASSKKIKKKKKQEGASFRNFLKPAVAGKINVVMEGKALVELLHDEAGIETKKSNLVMERFQNNNEDENPMQIDEESSQPLALIKDFGTIQRRILTRRPGKLVPISTLKPQQIFTSYVNFVTKNVSEIPISGNETEDPDQDTDNTKADSTEPIEYNSSDKSDDQKQRKRSKIRSVEEILSSLKSDDYLNTQRESDVRIDALIKRVLERTDEEDEIYPGGMNESRRTSEQKLTKEHLPKEIDGKGEFEREAERVLEELEMEQSLQSLDPNMLAQTSFEDTLSRVETERTVSVLGQKPEDIPEESEELLIDLLQNTDATNEELIGIHGTRLESKYPREKILPGKVSFTTDTGERKPVHKSIHDICFGKNGFDPVIEPLTRYRVEQYIPDKFPNHKMEFQNNTVLSEKERIERAAQNIINEKEKIEEWERMAHKMLDESLEIEIIGTGIGPKAQGILDVWQCAAPKLYLQPHKAKEILCPKYNIEVREFLTEDVTAENTFEKMSVNEMLPSTESSFCQDVDLEAMETKEKMVSRRSGSLENIASELSGMISSNAIVDNGMRTRSSSVPNRHWLEEDSLIIHLEYHQIMEEIKIQKQNIKMLNSISHTKDVVPQIQEREETEPEVLDKNKEDNQPENPIPLNGEVKETTPIIQDSKEFIMTPAQKALIAGRNYVYYPPRRSRKSKSKQTKNIARISAIEKFLDNPPNKLEKTESFSNLVADLHYGKMTSKKTKTRPIQSHCRSNSLSKMQSFSIWSSKYGYNNNESAREWITVVWDKWFDEVYPPLPDIGGMASLANVAEKSPITRDNASNLKESTQDNTMLTTSINEIIDLPEKIDAVLEEVDAEYRDSVIETLHEEISNLTKEMTTSSKPNAFLLSRRGSIYRKLGFLRGAMRDLDEAISMEPELLTAYWERHLLHLISNKLQSALEDLNFILKRDKNNVAAYKSRAAIYVSLGDISLAISNLSQAIRLAPNDPDAYLKRADLYEKNEEHRLALEDYNQLIQLQPNNSLAMMKHGLYYINIEQWHLAIKDFSDVLRHDPLNAEARLYRGMALSKLHQWQEALLDYSAVIHLDPNNSKAFFRRGCLLQQSDPNMAIRDFSISLLLDSSDENLLSYLYRAVLYAQTKQYREAIVDFEMVIYYSKDMCCAHIDLGLIYFENEEYEKAIKYFTLGLGADPTYIRGYACRAEAYFKLNMFDEAIKDINRAIHIYPDRSNYYMLRGDFYLAKGKMKLAEMCVRQAAAISHSLGQSLVQQALVHSFLHNYDQAIEALFQSTRSKPTLALLNLLGITQMKAKRWKDAITSFSICLEQMKPKSQFKPWPPAAANLNFMVAQCHLELHDYKRSQQAFKATVKINPKHAEAFYQQGWCRLRLGQLKKGILDLNQALAINPKLYQAYLARATLFGYKKQYTKAILNCNEVLHIEPKCLRAYLYRGVLKYHIKAYSLAVKDLTEAINLDQSCILAYFNRALCYNAERRYFKSAIQDYSIVLLLKDELSLHQKTYLNRGIVYLELGDVSNALFDFSKAHSMDAGNINVLMAVGICHHRLRNLNEAVLTFSRCLDSNPRFHLARICRGNVYMDFNTHQSQELAIKDYEAVLTADPKNLDAFVNLGYCMQAQGKFKKAWEIFTKAIEKHPNSIKAFDGRAIVCMQMKDLRGSLKDLNCAIAINAQSAMLYTNRAVVHQLMGDGIQSMKDYNKAILIDGDRSHIALYNIGCVYLHNFQIQQAYDRFNKSLEIDPSDEAAWMNMALVHVFNDHFLDAIKCIDKAIALAPYVAYFYYNRANVHYQLQDYQHAEKDFSKCLSISPDDAQVHKARADCRGKLGDQNGAIQDYKMSVYISTCQRRFQC